MELETSLALLHGSSVTPFPEMQDQYRREPFRHPALEGLAGVSAESKDQVLNRTRTAQLAKKYGLDSVLRWKPKRVCSRLFTLVYNLQQMELTFDFLDAQSQRLRPTHRVIASAVRYYGSHCITEGGRGSGQCCAKAVPKTLGARISHSFDLKKCPRTRLVHFNPMPGLKSSPKVSDPLYTRMNVHFFAKLNLSIVYKSRPLAVNHLSGPSDTAQATA